MPNIEVAGKQVEVDEDGYMVNLDDWNKDIALSMAKADGIDLAEAHWEIINFLRDYYQKYQIAPMIKILVKEVGKVMGPEKGNTKYLYELFPDGPAKQACRYAGLPKPTGCV
jgi:TusE/DsrC/DsvC family sulfur relay protein